MVNQESNNQASKHEGSEFEEEGKNFSPAEKKVNADCNSNLKINHLIESSTLNADRKSEQGQETTTAGKRKTNEMEEEKHINLNDEASSDPADENAENSLHKKTQQERENENNHKYRSQINEKTVNILVEPLMEKKRMRNPQ